MQCKSCKTDISLVPKTTLIEGVCLTCLPRKEVTVTERVSLDGELASGQMPTAAPVEKELRG